MERESFEDNEIATVLNEHFIAIKVDREERPDIDSIYMEVCHALTGSGGWPLTVFLTPNKKPFYAGTYFPKYSMKGLIGLTDLLSSVNKQWRENKSDLLNSAEEITRVIRENINEFQHGDLDEHILERTFNTLEMSFDKTYGGFGSKPKFPSPHNLLFLLRYGIYNKVYKAIDMVEKTLIQMYKGGIFDHIGFGFSRYSVDKQWLVPHFEKMLYDNALLLMVYSEIYQLTKKDIYKEVAEKMISFISSEMTSPEGAFYTALDADSEGEEGKFYTWTKDEIYEALNESDADLICRYFNITESGNFEGSNILNLIHQEDIETNNQEVERIRKLLYEVRENRVHPYKDDKIHTSLNGMMIASLSIAGRIFNKEEYIEQAEQALEFINKNLITKEYRILARYRDHEAKYLGYLDDYAYYIWGLIELFLSTGKEEYIKRAMDFNTRAIDLFEDANNGGFYQTGKDSEELIMKNKEIYDGAIPSGNSVMTMNFIRLSEIADDIGLERLTGEQIRYFSVRINEVPNAYTFMLSAYILKEVPRTKIVLIADKDSHALKNIHELVNSKYMPFTTMVTLYKETIANSGIFGGYDSYTEEIACHICENYHCTDPMFNENEIKDRIMQM